MYGVPPIAPAADPANDFEERVRASWSRWYPDLINAANATSEMRLFSILIDDLILNAAGAAPGRVIASKSPLPPWSWSELALEGALAAAQSNSPTSPDSAPVWALLIGLHAQGFDRDKLRYLLAEISLHGSDVAEGLNRLIEGAAAAPPGTLCVVTNKFEPGDLPTPCLILQASDVTRYEAATEWLMDHQVIGDMSRGQTC